MAKLIVFLALITCAYAAPKVFQARAADKCKPENCQLPDCRCSGFDIPGGLNKADIPQLVFLTFDDAVNAINYEQYKEAFFDRVNPDGCPISTTYFTSHEYTDYSKVHALHAQGHEIALHSITHNSSTEHWANLTVEELEDEFGGQKEMLSYFANIDEETIQGARLPLLQLSGDNTFIALSNVGLKYDCSWPTRNPFWPYTLNYLSTQDCPLGSCPTSSVPGFWVVPMIMLYDDLNVTCSMVDACVNIPDDVDGIFNFLLTNFERNYKDNKAPFGLYMHAAWFGQKANAYEAYLKFLDHIQDEENFQDVYIVSVQRGLEWVRNPKKANEPLWDSCPNEYEIDCPPRGEGTNCQLNKGEEVRYMRACTSCPDVYPWLHNPLGESNEED